MTAGGQARRQSYWLVMLAACFALAVRLWGAESPPPRVTVEWFYTDGCHMCAEVKQLMRDLEERYGDALDLRRNEITELENYKRMMRFEGRHGITEAAPMEVFVGSRYALGYDAILKQLPALIEDALARAAAGMPAASPPADPAVPARARSTEGPGAGDDARAAPAPDPFRRIRPYAVAAGGLLDGINPCAFATVVFLVSVLSMRRASRRRQLATGLAFAAGVFSAYFLIGFGALGALTAIRAYRAVSDALYWAIVGGVTVLAALSLHDAWRYKRTGSARGTVLKLSDASRGRVHAVLRWLSDTRFVFVAALAAGLIVSLLEVVCTGQIYLPTLMLMVRHDPTRASGVGYLLLYNVMFIVPLLAVLALYVYGVGGERFMRFSRRSFVCAKLLMALFFALLAILLVLGRIGALFAVHS